MRLGGTPYITRCSFISNSASSRGFAVAMVGPEAFVWDLLFEDNRLDCPTGFFLEDTLHSNGNERRAGARPGSPERDEGNGSSRYDAVCLDCPAWMNCRNCSIASGHMLPTCSSPLAHTEADKPRTTLETLTISPGYWRATNQSKDILECFNRDACNGGRTGAERFCASGYTGPCE